MRIHMDIGIKRIASNKIKDIWPKIGLCLIKYKERWKRTVKRVMREMKRGREMTKQKMK
jgi:hypothetical protein